MPNLRTKFLTVPSALFKTRKSNFIAASSLESGLWP